MATARWDELAQQLAAGTKVSSGDKVSIFVTDRSALDAAEAFVAQCYRLGAHPEVLWTDEHFDHLALANASDADLQQPSAMELAAMEWADVHVSFRGMVPPPASIDHHRAALQRRGKGVVSTARWQGTRWCLVRVPTPEWAQMIGSHYGQLMDEFFAGTLANWAELEGKQQVLCEQLNRASWVQVTADDTDIRFGVAGRTWVSFAGEANLPDGEVATAPLDDQVDGFITFPGTFWFAGVPITELRLEFEGGEVVSVAATEGESFVETIIATDPGARRVGELGIGTNSAVSTYTGDLLIDEKILGTVHFALGRAYPECGGVNQSSIHWDIVKDLRAETASLTSDVGDLIVQGKPGPLLESL